MNGHVKNAPFPERFLMYVAVEQNVPNRFNRSITISSHSHGSSGIGHHFHEVEGWNAAAVSRFGRSDPSRDRSAVYLNGEALFEALKR